MSKVSIPTPMLTVGRVLNFNSGGQTRASTRRLTSSASLVASSRGTPIGSHRPHHLQSGSSLAGGRRRAVLRRCRSAPCQRQHDQGPRSAPSAGPRRGRSARATSGARRTKANREIRQPVSVIPEDAELVTDPIATTQDLVTEAGQPKPTALRDLEGDDRFVAQKEVGDGEACKVVDGKLWVAGVLVVVALRIHDRPCCHQLQEGRLALTIYRFPSSVLVGSATSERFPLSFAQDLDLDQPRVE